MDLTSNSNEELAYIDNDVGGIADLVPTLLFPHSLMGVHILHAHPSHNILIV